MRFISFEHSQLTYYADFMFYGAASLALALFLIVAAPAEQRLALLGFAFSGLVGWTLIEYGLHRLVLHRVRPFCTWHAEHHRRPVALIGTPTLVSAALIVLLIFLPALVWQGLWLATALTFGVLTGYLGYSITHHATHHWRSDNAWLMRRKVWHAKHHRTNVVAGHYGVTCSIWDYVFGSCSSESTPTLSGDKPSE